MSSLSTVEAKLPPGFRFHPRDEELICDYLMNWVGGCSPPLPLLIEVDLNKCEPWDIPAVACVGGKEWYFYSQRDRKYATGLRTNRATVSGYWKATGKDRPIFRKGSFLVGMRKTLVFYQGRAPKGKKTDWVMHEFRIQQGPSPPTSTPTPTPTPREDWVLCRVFYKSRSELIASKLQETASMMKEAVTPRSSFSAASLPPLMGFEPTADQAGPSDNEQVPCFSIFVNHQTNPSFSLMDPPPAELIHPDVGNYINPPPPLMNSSDNKMMSVVLHHLTKMESSGNEEMSIIKGGSPSFGEGSSDSYLSEVGSLSSMWNHYS